MYILRIEPVQKSKVKVCFDDGTDFILYKKEAHRFNLENDTELSSETYDAIMKEIFVPRAKKRAMHLLEKMERTEYSLRTKLKESGYPTEAIDIALEYVKSYNYVDDFRYASSYVRFYQESRSKRRIEQDLLKKGVSKDTIALAMDCEYKQSEEELIKELMSKKHFDPSNCDRKERDKMIRFLLGRGYAFSDISRVLSTEILS